MHFKTLCILLSISIFLACTSRNDNKSLLSIPVKSTAPVIGEELEYYKDHLQQNNDTENIIRVLSHMWLKKYSHAKTTVSFVEKHTKASHLLYDITLIFDNIPDDDSISGYRYSIEIQHSDSTFNVVKLDESWRCWPGRGHQYFSAEPCK